MSAPPPSPEHGPALGASHRLFGRLHVTGVFWYRLHYWGVAHMPPWGIRVGMLAFTTFFFLSLGRIRTAIAANLDPVLGRAGLGTRARRAYRTMYEFAECLTEKYRRAAVPERMQFVVEGEEHWLEVTAEGRGVVLVTAHIGPWEIGAQLGAAEGERRVHVVREGEIDPRAQAFVRELVKRGGANYVTHFAGDDPRLTLELRDVLVRGEIVALQGDRPRSGGRTVRAAIFGRPVPLPTGPAALARAAVVPMLPVFNFREGPLRMRTVVRPPIQVAATPDREADTADAMRRFAEEIEWAIRERPHQWFCFRNLWP